MKYFKSIGEPKGMQDVLKNRGDQSKYLMSFAQEILREPSALDSKTKELIAAFTSRLNKCEYCEGSHTVFAISLGIDEELLNKCLNEDYETIKLKPLLDYVKILTTSPSMLNKKNVENVLDGGYTEQELQDAIFVCAAFNMFNRIIEGHGVSKNEDTWLQSSDIINKVGYDGRYFK